MDQDTKLSLPKRRMFAAWLVTFLGVFAFSYYVWPTLGARLNDPSFIWSVAFPTGCVLVAVGIWSVVRLPGAFTPQAGVREGDVVVGIVLTVSGLMSTYTASEYANMEFDRAPTTELTVQEIGRSGYHSRKSGDHYQLLLQADIADTRHSARYQVDQFFYKISQGQRQYRVILHPGAFGYPWISDLQIIH